MDTQLVLNKIMQNFQICVDSAVIFLEQHTENSDFLYMLDSMDCLDMCIERIFTEEEILQIIESENFPEVEKLLNIIWSIACFNTNRETLILSIIQV